jgi:hypothetical protein
LGAYGNGHVDTWCEQFSHATVRAAREASGLATAIGELQSQWIERLGDPRRDAAVRQLVTTLPAQPVIDVAVARQLTGKSHVAVGNALRRLELAGILKPLDERRWGRVWACAELLDLVGHLEERIATPRGT